MKRLCKEHDADQTTWWKWNGLRWSYSRRKLCLFSGKRAGEVLFTGKRTKKIQHTLLIWTNWWLTKPCMVYFISLFRWLKCFFLFFFFNEIKMFAPLSIITCRYSTRTELSKLQSSGNDIQFHIRWR